MNAEIEAVIRLQGLDDKAALLQKEIDALPKQVAGIERQLDAHIRKLQADKAALAASLKKRKSLEDDSKAWEAKISKLKDQMQQAKTNDQFKAFQNEIDYATNAIRAADDQILEIMGSSEPLEAAVKAAEKALAEEKVAVTAQQEDARKRTAEDQAALKLVLVDRVALAATVAPAALNLYERARKRWKKSGISDASSGRCEACHIALRPMVFQELRSATRIMTCESCGRIIYYNPPVNIEVEMNVKA